MKNIIYGVQNQTEVVERDSQLERDKMYAHNKQPGKYSGLSSINHAVVDFVNDKEEQLEDIIHEAQDHTEQVATNYPPILTNEHMIDENNFMTYDIPSIGRGIISFTVLHNFEWFVSNAASLMFLIGSFYFWPSLTREDHLIAALLFIIGSCLFTMASTSLSIRLNAFSMEDTGLFLNCVTYIIANILFIVGSFMFIPDYENDEILGVWLFLIGSIMFLIAPAYDFYRFGQ